MQPYNSLSEKIIRNTLYNTAGRIWELGVSLFLSPYIIYHIGLERYGIWVIVCTLSYSLGFLSFSIEAPIIKYAAEYYAKKDTRNFIKLFNTGLCFYLLLSLGCVILGLPLAHVIVKLLDLKTAVFGEAVFAIKIGIIIFGFTNIFLFFNAVLKGLQLMDIANKIFISNSIVRIIGIAFVLENGFGLKGLILVGLIEIIFGFVVMLWVTFKKIPWLTINPFYFKPSIFRQFFTFGAKLHLAKLSFLISFHMDKFLLARFIGITAVGFYDLGSKICFSAVRISGLIISAILPAFSDADASGREILLQELLDRSIKYLSVSSCVFFAFLIPNADLILASWLKGSYPEAVLILQILSVGYFFNTLVTSMSTYAIGIGKPELEMKHSLFVAPVNLLTSIILILLVGLPGAAIGTSFALTTGALYFIVLIIKHTHVSYVAIIRAIKIPFVSACIATIACVPFMLMPLTSPVYTSRLHDITALCIRGAVYCATFAVSSIMMGILDRRDRDIIKIIFGNRFPVKIISALRKNKQ